MKAILFDQFCKIPELVEAPTPIPSRSAVVVKVEATGICRSDWHGWMGHDNTITLPHVPGHELAGTIEVVGSGIARWKVGDRVTVPFVCGCGDCVECRAGDHQVCRNQFQPGFTAWGSFAQYVAIDYADQSLVRLPDGMNFSEAASLGCRFVTAYRALVDQGKVAAGDWVAVHGCGGVGLSVVMIAKAKGANVLAIDVSDDTLSFAQNLGATAVLNVRTAESVVEEIVDVTNGGPHISVDAVGTTSAFQNSLRSLRRRGKHIQVGLLTEGESIQKFAADALIAHELEIIGSHGIQAHKYQEIFSLIEDSGLDPKMLVTDRIALTEAPHYLATFDKKEKPGITVIDRFA